MEKGCLAPGTLSMENMEEWGETEPSKIARRVFLARGILVADRAEYGKGSLAPGTLSMENFWKNGVKKPSIIARRGFLAQGILVAERAEYGFFKDFWP